MKSLSLLKIKYILPFGMKSTGYLVVVFVLVLMLVVVGRAQGDPYEDVLEELKLMRNHINELEVLAQSQQKEIKNLKGNKDEATSEDAALDVEQDVLDTRLASFKDELMETLTGNESPLEITGFFDFTVQDMDFGTDGMERDRPFDFGAFELDLEYSYGDHYAVSTALVWDDGATPELAVGIVDYHLFDDDVPVRGRIFDEPGFHVQVGRFDIPYGVDYQYFASVDRPNVSAPLTTERIQAGGYNSDGIRLYGTWKSFDYTAYAVNSLYEEDGVAVGGRFAFFPTRNPYRLHHFGSSRFAELGISYLRDMDKEFDKHSVVYGIDFTLNYNMFTLVTEWMKRRSDEDVLSGDDVNLGEQDESGYHISLVSELEDIVKRPLYFFGRFDTWDPDHDFILDEEDDTLMHEVGNLRRLTFGLGYRITDSIGLKVEYFDHQGQGSKEPSFEDSGVTFQLTASF
jgi:hypothetical protein